MRHDETGMGACRLFPESGLYFQHGFAVRRLPDAHKTLPFFPRCSERSMKSKKRSPRKRSALAKESERIQLDQIRRLLALPPSRRTHFLRKRLSFRGSAI